MKLVNKIVAKFKHYIKCYKARMRLDLDAVCELSKDLGPFDDYHDYMDDVLEQPYHFLKLKCRRCGKIFYV